MYPNDSEDPKTISSKVGTKDSELEDLLCLSQ